MDILIVGNIENLPREFYKNMAQYNKLVLCHPNLPKIDGAKIEVYRHDFSSEYFSHLFRIYDFEVMIYFSYLSQDKSVNEIWNVDFLLQMCNQKKKIKFIYVKLIPPATFEPPVRTFGATIPALESHIFR